MLCTFFPRASINLPSNYYFAQVSLKNIILGREEGSQEKTRKEKIRRREKRKERREEGDEMHEGHELEQASPVRKLLESF